MQNIILTKLYKIILKWVHVIFIIIKRTKKLLFQGKLKYKETFTNGFDNMPKAFVGLFHGDNTGKAIIKA